MFTIYLYAKHLLINLLALSMKYGILVLPMQFQINKYSSVLMCPHAWIGTKREMNTVLTDHQRNGHCFDLKQLYPGLTTI